MSNIIIIIDILLYFVEEYVKCLHVNIMCTYLSLIVCRPINYVENYNFYMRIQIKSYCILRERYKIYIDNNL